MATLHAEKSRAYALNLGAMIFRVRDERGMTQTDLGKVVKAHKNTIARWEKGKAMPTPYQVKLLRELVRRVPVVAR